jgi:hypothetical protein
VVIKLEFAVSHAASEAYTPVPQTFALFHQVTPRKNKERRPHSEATLPAPSQVPCRQASSPSSEAKVAAAKLKGLLCWSGSAHVLLCDSTFYNFKTQQKARLCIGHVFLGQYCQYGDQCKFIHINALVNLASASECTVLSNYVSDTTDICFAPGRKPSPGNATGA